MSRLDLIPAYAFSADFRELRRQIEEIKQQQRIGRDVLRTKIIECLDGDGNPTLYDKAGIWNGDRYYADFVATFTADHQLEPWATPIFVVSIGDPYTAPGASEIAGNSYLNFANTVEGKIAYSGGFGTNNFGDTRQVYLKVYFYATDTGVLVVT